MSRRGKSNAEAKLSKGRRIRSQMSSEMRLLKQGRIHIWDILHDPSDAQGRCSVYDVLRYTPMIGERTARKLCIRFQIWPHDPVASIPPEKRNNLYAALPERVRR
jgi:hypothetical protein